MLIGRKNIINYKLVKELQPLYSVQLMEFGSELDSELSKTSSPPPVVIVNLIDIPDVEPVLNSVKKNFPDTKVIAIHTFENEAMIETILDKGFDAYLPIFKFSEEVVTVFNNHNILSE